MICYIGRKLIFFFRVRPFGIQMLQVKQSSETDEQHSVTSLLYSFCRGAIIKFYKLRGLTEQKFNLSQFWRLEIKNQVVGGDMLL